MSSERGTIVLAAGGTGGHLFPAQALAEELGRRGYDIHLMTDERVRDYGKSFPASAVHLVPSATLVLGKPSQWPANLLRLSRGYRQARAILQRVRPKAVVGFGGYPSIPPILAATRLGIPTCLHDQNAVMGRANRMLAGLSTRIASSFPHVTGLPAGAKKKVVFTGNPVRDAVVKEKAAPYPELSANGPFNLLIFGGSQGARFFGEFIPQAIAELPAAMLSSLGLTQQCRAEDMEAARTAYERLGVSFELQPFFMDMPRRIANSHLVICRSGATTIAELGVIGRPAIMVPLPNALDNDQLRNAESFAAGGAGWICPQAKLEPKEFAAFLTRLRYQESGLRKAAAAAIAHGVPDAASRLADVTEQIGGMQRQ